jgi:DNA repair exonuclease SbcCD ATPase subunit
MKPSIPLRAEQGEFDAEGLSSRMDKFFNNPDQLKAEEKPLEPTKAKELEAKPNEVELTKQIEPEKKTEKLEAKLDPPDTDGTDEEEEDFPELGKTKAEEESKEDDEQPGFDEAKFDKETEDEIKGMDDKAGEKWKQLKAQVKQAKQEALEAKKAVEQSKPNPEVERELAELRSKAAEAEALRKRNEELLRVNDKVAVEESEEYIAKVKQPFAEMESVIEGLAASAKVPVDYLYDIVTEMDVAKQDAMLAELEDKVSGRMASRIERIADDYKSVVHTKKQMLENATKTLEAARIAKHQAAQKEKEQSLKAFKISAEESFTKYAAKIPSFTDSTGNLTDLAKDVMSKTAVIDPSTLSTADLGYMAFCTNSFPQARKEIVKLQTEIKRLKIAAGQNTGTISGTPSGGKVEEGEPVGLFASMAGKEFSFSPP